MVMKAIIILLAVTISSVNSKTITKRIQTCDGYTRQIIGERYIGTKVRGQIRCRFAPKDSSYTLAINMVSLDLKKQGAVCPILKFIGFTHTMMQPDIDDDGINIVDRSIQVPADPENLMTVTCENYTQNIGHLVTAKKLGQKVEMIYSSIGLTKVQENPFDLVLFSFRTGTGLQCPAKHFRCWSDRYMCIDQSLECDGEMNCRDNSDEDNFKCTGRIGPLTLGMFIVMLALALLIIIGIIIGVIFYRRRQTKRKARKREQRAIVMESQVQQPFMSDPTQPRQYFAAPPESDIAT